MPQVSRRRLLQYLGLAPAIPLVGRIGQIPWQEVPIRNEAIFASGGAFTASGGVCAPVAPYYDLPWPADQRPIRESLPTVKARR